MPRIVNDVTKTETHQGADGIDFFDAQGNSGDFTLSIENDGTIKMVSDFFPLAPDTLRGIERVQFSDGVLAFDDYGKAGQAYRLYQAAFDRKPDAEGLGFWIDNYDKDNVDLVEMAGYFMQSAEFAEKYGPSEGLSDQAYLTLLYNNVLDRDPDQAGFDFWRDQQGNGLSRADMLQYFSESTENNLNVATAISDGIWYT